MSVWPTRVLIALAVTACSSNKGDHPKPQETTASVPKPAEPATSKPAVDDRYDAGSLGAISFALTEGTPEARAHFNRGLLALHSFWYDEAIRQFDAAIASDPTMNMAYWGGAMSRCKLLWGDDDLAAARQMLGRMPDPDHLSPREQAWILAALELLGNGDVLTSRKKFAAAMEKLNADFPDDESATFLAIALLSTTRPEDPDTLTVRKRVAALATGVFQHNPKHPGAAHYLIHAYDTPELASLALPFARDYAKIAPAAFHARHMPAHIFSRLGMWNEAIASCQSAWDASVAAARSEKLSADHHDFHSLNWLIEMNFELGRRKAADGALALFASAVRGGLGHQLRGLYATQVASYMIRTGEWARADELLAPLDAPAVEDPSPPASPPAPSAGAGSDTRTEAPHSHCGPAAASSPGALFEKMSVLDARARAAAALHDVAKTTRILTDMDAVRDQLRGYFQATQPKEAIARIDEAHERRRASLIAQAGANDRALLKVLRASAVDGDRESGGESNPSGFVIHEEIADILLRLGQPKEAVAEYTLTLDKHPRRAHALLGAARAAAKSGDLQASRSRYQELLDLWATADETTDGLSEARAAVAAK